MKSLSLSLGKGKSLPPRTLSASGQIGLQSLPYILSLSGAKSSCNVHPLVNQGSRAKSLTEEDLARYMMHTNASLYHRYIDRIASSNSELLSLFMQQVSDHTYSQPCSFAFSQKCLSFSYPKPSGVGRWPWTLLDMSLNSGSSSPQRCENMAYLRSRLTSSYLRPGSGFGKHKQKTRRTTLQFFLNCASPACSIVSLAFSKSILMVSRSGLKFFQSSDRL